MLPPDKNQAYTPLSTISKKIGGYSINERWFHIGPGVSSLYTGTIVRPVLDFSMKVSPVAKEKVSLEIGGHKLEKVDNPVYLGVTSYPRPASQLQ